MAVGVLRKTRQRTDPYNHHVARCHNQSHPSPTSARLIARYRAAQNSLLRIVRLELIRHCSCVHDLFYGRGYR